MIHARRSIQAWVAVAAVALGVAVPARAVTQLNLGETFANVRQIIADGGQADILFLGDSLSVRDGSYLPFLRQMLQDEFGDAGLGYQAFSKWTGAAFNQGNVPGDPAWTLGLINNDTEPHYSLDGLWATADPGLPTGATTAEFDALAGAIELHYLAQPGGGQFDVILPDSSVVTIDTNSTTREVRAWSHTFADDQRTLIFQPDGSGPVTIFGQNNLIDSPGVRLHRAANGGWGVDNFLQRDDTFDAQLDLLDPDVVAVWLGTNNQDLEPPVFADMLTQLTDRVQAQLPDSKLLLIGSYDSGGVQIANLVNAMQDVAAMHGFGFVNLYELGGPNHQIQFNGLLDDGLHFNDRGGQYFANLLFDKLFPAMMPAWPDTDADGQIGLSDLDNLLTHWNQQVIPGERTAGDFDQDGYVGLDDLTLLLQRWGEVTPGVPIIQGDLNRDGVVGLDDLDILLNEWGSAIEPGEPLTGDADLNGIVGLNDLDLVLQHWNQNVTPGDLSSGDLNDDGFVGLDDLTALLLNWNQTNVSLVHLEGDITGDGLVGLDDLDLLLRAWPDATPPQAGEALPEPATVSVLVLGLAAILKRQK